jgi:hypothetical protein
MSIAAIKINMLLLSPLAGLDPAIHVFVFDVRSLAKTWTPGTSPGEGNYFLQTPRVKRGGTSPR